MFEHTTLQEAYTGALIAGKGKGLNNINLIMERSKFKHEDWVRVRFGAGTPWRRCWCVISPPDEKEYQRIQKEMNKKKSAYDRSRPPILKGDIRFYENNKKPKKTKPIAQITNAYSAFAIYPQSKPLIDASTLVKVEGTITIFSNPPTISEGFVFVMPEVHPAVTGFEMMLRWLFPVWDTFSLYGRPGRLIADTNNPNSLMFAMPKERRYGYLEILDVSGLISTDGSQNWNEGDWRRNMKELTARRIATIGSGSGVGSRYSSRRSTRNSFGPSRSQVNFNDSASVRSSQGSQGPPEAGFGSIPRTDLTPTDANTFQPRQNAVVPQHHRSISESQGLDRYSDQGPSGYDGSYETAPAPPPHTSRYGASREGPSLGYQSEPIDTPDRISSEEHASTPVRELRDFRETASPEPVAAPPAFSHAPGTLPAAKPYHSPELRKAKSRMSTATLAQMAGAGGMAAGTGIEVAHDFRIDGFRTDDQRMEDRRGQDLERYSEDGGQKGLLSDINSSGWIANPNGPNEGLVAARNNGYSPKYHPLPPPPTSNVNDESYDRSNPSSLKYQKPILPLQGVGPTTLSRLEPSEFQNSMPGSAPKTANTFESQNHSASVTQKQTIIPGHLPRSYTYTSSDSSISQQPSRLETSPVLRKPLPVRNSLHLPESPVDTPVSSSSLGDVIDQAGFDRVVPRGQANSVTATDPQAHPQSSAASLYDDTISTSTPDYASTHESVETRPSVERPRAGKMRTVGGAEPNHSQSTDDLHSSIPPIDFGPTFNYAANRPPGRPSPDRRADPIQAQESARTPKSSGRNATNTDVGQYRNDPNSNVGGRTVPWQPGMAAAGTIAPGGRAITPEQFVQQRAAAATSPIYAHQRQSSSNTLRSSTPTPPLARNQSSEHFPHSRNSSGDPPQRPSSRGPTTSLGVSGTGDYSTHLSAREQEHVARVTGSPLINIPDGSSKAAAPNNGLVGAISAREREKRDLKQGMSSQAVQQAIVQRQQQNQAQQLGQQGQTQYYAQARSGQMFVPPQYQGYRQYSEQYTGQLGKQPWVQPAAPQPPYGSSGQYQAYTATPQNPPQTQVQPQMQFQPQAQPQVLPRPVQQQQQYTPNPQYSPQIQIQQQPQPQVLPQRVQQQQQYTPSPPYSPQVQTQQQPQPQIQQQPQPQIQQQPQPQPQQLQQWVSPAASVFAQGGGWSSPQQRVLTPEQQQRQQYFHQQQQQQQQHQGQIQGPARGRGQQVNRGQGQGRGY
jgi:CCR4-NOT transcriptional complex subunit CAF120